jgi:hypothetical protein
MKTVNAGSAEEGYLRTYERGLFLYLYLLLDEFSRKVINPAGSRTATRPPKKPECFSKTA